MVAIMACKIISLGTKADAFAVEGRLCGPISDLRLGSDVRALATTLVSRPCTRPLAQLLENRPAVPHLLSCQEMQPSELEIQREVETLRDIKRRSSAPGGVLDPDLPTVSSDSGSSTAYWEDSSSSSHGDSSEGGSGGGDDPFSLFWVPARLHPEIAPAEFRQFLKEHARAPTEGAQLERTGSLGSSTSLGRKKSMLSRQYHPSEKDGVEDETVVPIRRNRTSVFANQGPQLTINDLQKLEELAEEASQSRDPSKLRSVLRRSMSLNVAPSGMSYLCTTGCHD